MKEKLLLFAASVFLFSCNLNTPPQNNLPGKIDSIKIGRDTQKVVKEYHGLYNPATWTFRSCDNDSIYYITDKTKGLDSAIAKIDFSETIFLAIKGYEEHNSEENSIVATELLKAEQKSYRNTCIPYDYWCFGTEPFWQIQISQKENLIDFYSPMERKMTHFEYKKPEIKDGIATYVSSDNENKISIIIKKEKCNGAIDPQYDYSAEVTLNDKSYAGCASKP